MLDVVAVEEADAAATAEEETDADATEEELYEMLATEAAAEEDETVDETVDEVKTAEDENTYCDEVATAVLVPKRFSGAGVGMAISWAAS